MSRRAAGGRAPAERVPWYDPAIVLGSSGPTRVAREEDADPAYQAPRIRGFGHSVADVAPAQVQAIAGAMGSTFAEAAAACDRIIDAFRPEPLLWEGDQA